MLTSFPTVTIRDTTMASELEKTAKEELIKEDFLFACNLAIDLDPSDAILLAERAQALIELNAFYEAICDANKAIELEPSFARAYLRKGTAYIKVKEYHKAKRALQIGAFLAPHDRLRKFIEDCDYDSRFTRLIEECDHHIAEESNGLINSSSSSSKGPISTVSSGDGSHSCDRSAEAAKEGERDSSVSQTNEVTPISPGHRLAYSENCKEVKVEVSAEGIPAKNVAVDFGEQILSFTIDEPGEGVYHYQCQLVGKIIPDESRVEVLPSRVEFHLAKAEASIWTPLTINYIRKRFPKNFMPASELITYAMNPFLI